MDLIGLNRRSETHREAERDTDRQTERERRWVVGKDLKEQLNLGGRGKNSPIKGPKSMDDNKAGGDSNTKEITWPFLP